MTPVTLVLLLVAAPPVTAVTFTPDGKALVVGSQAGLHVRSWTELKTDRTLKTELPHVHTLAFSPDGKILAAAGGEPGRKGMVELYRWPDGTLIHRFRPHRDLIYGLAWRADSAAFATASADRMVGIHDVKGTTTHMLDGHSRPVLAVLFLPGNQLLTAGVDASLRLWDADGKPVRTLANHTLPVHDLALRPGGDETPFVVSVGDDRTIRFWQPTRGRLVRFARLESIPQAVAWTTDGNAVVVACKDGRVRVIDPDTAEVKEEISAIEGVAYSLAVTKDGSAVVGGQGGQVRRIELRK